MEYTVVEGACLLACLLTFQYSTFQLARLLALLILLLFACQGDYVNGQPSGPTFSRGDRMFSAVCWSSSCETQL